MRIMNLSAVERRMKINILNTVLSCIVTFLGVMCIIAYSAHIYLAVLYTVVTIGVILLGYTEISSYVKIKHDVELLQGEEHHVKYRDDCVCYGDERLQAFSTMLQVSTGGVYLDIQNKTILVPRIKQEEMRAIRKTEGASRRAVS